MSDFTETKWGQATGYLEWAKVFPTNRDTTSTDAKVQKFLKKHDGQYSVNFYPADEEEEEKLWNLGLSNEVYNSPHPRYRDGNPDLGTGKYFIFKRRHKDIKDTKKGEIDFGGAPKVVHWYEGRMGDPWNIESDGLLGNGTKATVKISVYGTDESQTVRLEALGIIDPVFYESEDGPRL